MVKKIVHLVSTIEKVNQEGLLFTFTDGHSIMEISSFYNDLAYLDQIDWVVMKSKYWHDTPTFPDRCRRRQAEFLVYNELPWNLVIGIGVIDDNMKEQVEEILNLYDDETRVVVKEGWYY
jgi:hypothetical protein